MSIYKTVSYRNHDIYIYYDEDAESPREWDNLGIMMCSHRMYKLGDEQFDSSDYSGWDDLYKQLVSEGAICIKPLYLYDHSGISISTSKFSCSWDSGQVGFIYTTKQKLEYLGFDWKKITKARLEKINDWLDSEVSVYNNFLTGEFYGYKTDTEDSCWGFIGDPETSGLLDEAKSSIDYFLEKKRKQKQEQLKKYITHQVPLN
jgi:hypothetical protein